MRQGVRRASTPKRRGPAKNAKHPRQPLITAPDGIIRFKGNGIVRYVLDCASTGRHCDLNTIAGCPFSDEDRRQFAQLLGYSESGYYDLSYAERE